MWLDDTRSIPLEKYKEATKRFFNYFSLMPGVVRYGTFGSVGAPGLSDLDLIVVVEDQCLMRKEFFIPELLGDENYIFTHSPLVIPLSLMNLLPYYHLIDITWADDLPDLDHSDIQNLSVIGSLHVLAKTFYLQSFLWGLLFKVNRPCKRSILALTSVARSVQWLQRLSIPVKKSDLLYVESILSLRSDWCRFPENREIQIHKLDTLLARALEIAIELPESLALHILGIQKDSIDYGVNKRGLQRTPMNFLLEAPVHNTVDIIKNVQNQKLFFKLGYSLWKFRPYIVGSFAFSGPLAFSIQNLDFVISKDYRDSIGAGRWGAPVDYDLYRLTESVLSETLQKRFSANLKFARAMNEAGLYNCNFGSVWLPHGFGGFFLRFLARTMGRLRILRGVHSVVNLDVKT